MTMELQTTDDLATTLDRVLREMDQSGRKLPEAAIREAQKHREAIRPRLVQAIKEAASRAASGDVPEGNLHYLAMYLLAEFGATEALPAIIEALSLPGDLATELCGDMITEDLPQILAALAPGSLELLDALIANREANEYVRWSAAEVYLHLVRDEILTREEAVEKLRGLLRAALAKDDREIIDGLVVVLDHFASPDALEEIREAFRRDLVDEQLINLESVEQDIARGDLHFQSELERCRPTGIVDTVHDVLWWSAESQDADEYDPDLPGFDEDAHDWKNGALDAEIVTPPTTIRRTEPRVGRNDPCPCGSGKKFKKCCGSR